MWLHCVSLPSKDENPVEGDSNQPLHYIVIHLCIKQMELLTVKHTVFVLWKNTDSQQKGKKKTHWNTPLIQMQDQVSQIKHAYVVFVVFYLYVIDI